MRWRVRVGVLFATLAFGGAPVFGQGIFAPSAGPINSAMAGASVAAPIEFGSSYWNPANISGLSSQEFLLGSSLIFPNINLESTIPANSIGGLFPPTTRSGTSRSSSGVASNLATGFSFRRTEDSRLTLGLGVFGLVGGGVNFAGSATTPILTPRLPPRYFGVGPIFSNISLLGINPMASYQVTDRLAIGGGPVITTTSAAFAPAFFAPTPGPLGLPTFPSATNSHPFWGAGFQIGLLYEINDDWNVGFSYKSPIWQQRWEYNAAYPNRAARPISLQASLPAIYSWGVAYKGLEKALIDVDLRYIDYANTELFGQSAASGGLGWRGVFAVATGMQYALTERLTLRGGYLFNTNPIPSAATLFNVQAPGITQNTLSLGASYAVTENITASFAWMHGFDNSIQGSILQVPGSSIKLTSQIDQIVMGVNMTFGGRKKVAVPEPVPPQPVPVAEPPIPLPLPTLPGPDATLTSVDGTDPQTTAPVAGDLPPAH